jgi:NitT/TauT family transport system substrate-binding protein
MKRFLIILIVILAFTASACKSGNEGDLREIRINLTYIPNVQFAPFYVAIEKGFFEAEGLKVNLVYGNEADMVALVGTNHEQFMIASGEQVLLSREQGLPVVAVAPWYKDYPVGVIALKEANIQSPEDLKGKKIGLPGLYGANYIGMEALAGQSGLKNEDYQLVSIGFTQVENLVSGTVDAAVVYLANEPVQLRERGYETDVMAVSDYIDLVGNCLVTNETTIKNEPELARAVVNAFLRALKYSAENPDEAWAISRKYVENLTEETAPIQRKVLDESIRLWLLEKESESEQAQSWSNMMKVLLDIGLMKKEIHLDEAYSNEFLP